MFGGYRPFPAQLGGGKPLARVYHESLRAALPSAMSSAPGTLNDCESLATARMLAAVWLSYERYKSNLLPGTAYELLLQWAERLGVTVRDSDSIQVIREACQAKYLANSRGANVGGIYDAVKALLGDMLVSITYPKGSDLDTPPADTYWPENPGSDPWTSSRCLMKVQATKPSNMSQDEFNYVMNVQLFHLLDPLIPATASFYWEQV